MNNSSIIPNLLYDLLAISKGEVTHYEKLFIIENSKNLWDPHELYLADLYTECGCFSNALPLYEKRGSFRKMGDLAWASNDLGLAKHYYSLIEGDHKPDWDRLLRIAYYQKDWEEIIRLFYLMEACPIPFEGQFVLGSSAVPEKPIIDLVLIALAKLGHPLDEKLLSRFVECMRVKRQDIERSFSAIGSYTDDDESALERRLRPRFIGRPCKLLNEAMQVGDTSRARQLMAYIIDADSILSQARERLHRFLSSSDDIALEEFIELITRSGSNAITETVRYEAMNLAWPSTWADYPDQSLIKLFSCHPCMNKRHFGQLLALKFRNGMPPSAEDILTGLFQRLAVILPTNDKPPLDYNRLISAREWAVSKCEQWAGHDGRSLIESVMSRWLSGQCRSAKTLFNLGGGKPKDPRDSAEWHELVNACYQLIAQEWKKELENSAWKSETQLYLLVKRTFKDYEVIRHASPSWLTPQHYDIYIPRLNLAIEYMGQQHYEPVDFFGGHVGFEETAKRDERKLRMSMACGVRLLHVKYDEDMKEVIKRIKQIGIS